MNREAAAGTPPCRRPPAGRSRPAVPRNRSGRCCCWSSRARCRSPRSRGPADPAGRSTRMLTWLSRLGALKVPRQPEFGSIESAGVQRSSRSRSVRISSRAWPSRVRSAYLVGRPSRFRRRGWASPSSSGRWLDDAVDVAEPEGDSRSARSAASAAADRAVERRQPGGRRDAWPRPSRRRGARRAAGARAGAGRSGAGARAPSYPPARRAPGAARGGSPGRPGNVSL